MKIIKIDVEKKEIYPVDYNGELKELYSLIGCDNVEAPIEYPNNDVLYCDEEACLSEDKIKGGFIFPKWSYPIVGNGLVVGTADNGDDLDCKSSLEDFKDIIWVSKEDAIKHARRVV